MGIENLLALKVIGAIKGDADYNFVNNRYRTYLGIINHLNKEGLKFNQNLYDQVNIAYADYLGKLNKELDEECRNILGKDE